MIDDLVLTEPQFYPAIYVLVSKLLDEFGQLVYDRLFALAVSPSSSHLYGQNQHNFVPQSTETETENGQPIDTNNHHSHHPKSRESVDSESALIDDEKDIFDDDQSEALPLNFRDSHCSNLCQTKCGNWFFKIAAIRELVPRILIEIALFRSLRFLYPLSRWMEYIKLLMLRLRGISNPLIAAYVRLFAAEQIFISFGTASFQFESVDSKDSNPSNRRTVDLVETVHVQALHDVLFVFGSMYRTKFAFVDCVFYAQMESADYLNLFHPVLETLFGILEHQKVFGSAHELKLYLHRHIEPELLSLIDLDSFLNIETKSSSDSYRLRLDEAANIYNKHRSNSGLNGVDRRRRNRKSEPATIAAFVELLEEERDGDDGQIKEQRNRDESGTEMRASVSELTNYSQSNGNLGISTKM